MKTMPSYGPVRTRRISIIGLVAAGMLVIMLVAQLFSYEDFASTLGVLLPFDNHPLNYSVAAGVVICELLGLPYLLRMYLSPLMRALSAVVAAMVSVFWLFTSLTGAHAQNSGLFSTTLDLPGGIVAAAWSLLLFGLVVTVVTADTRFRHAASS